MWLPLLTMVQFVSFLLSVTNNNLQHAWLDEEGMEMRILYLWNDFFHYDSRLYLYVL